MMVTLGGDDSGGENAHNNEILKIMDHFVIQECNSAKHSAIFPKRNSCPPLNYTPFKVSPDFYCHSSWSGGISAMKLQVRK